MSDSEFIYWSRFFCIEVQTETKKKLIIKGIILSLVPDLPARALLMKMKISHGYESFCLCSQRYQREISHAQAICLLDRVFWMDNNQSL